MKKIIFFVVCLFSFTFSSKAVTLTTDYQTNFHSNRFIDNVNYSGLLAYPRIDGKIVYCLNPKVIIGKEYIHNDLILNEYTKEQLEYLKLVAKYGYNEENNTIEYYAATQQLIWEYLDNSQSHFYWSTEKNSNGKIILINDELKHIRDSIDSFYEGISFQEFDLYGYVNETIYLQDFNNQLSNYEVESAGLNEAWIENNNLYIKINVKDIQEIKLKYKSNGSMTKTYSSVGYQNLISFGDDIEKNISIYIKGIDTPDLDNSPVEEIPPIDEEPPTEETPSVEENPIDEQDKSLIDENYPSEKIEEPTIDNKEEEIFPNEDNRLENESVIEEIKDDEKEELVVVEKEQTDEKIEIAKKQENIHIEQLPNTYNYEMKYYIYIGVIFLTGIGVYYKYI